MKDKPPYKKIWSESREERVRKRYIDVKKNGIDRFNIGEAVRYERYPKKAFVVIDDSYSDVYVDIKQICYDGSLEDKLVKSVDVTYSVDRNLLTRIVEEINETKL